MKSRHSYLRWHILVLIAGLAFTLISRNCIAQPEQELFAAGNKAYMDEKFDKAIENYEQLVTRNKVSAEVYFNLGNAYYKTGNIASAVLNYERARRLKPADEDIEYNLQIANLSTIDKIEPVPKVFYERWWNDFVNEGSVSQRSVWALIFLFLSLGVFAVYLFSGKVVIRKITFFATIGLLVCSLFTWYLTHLQHRHLNDHKAAVIFAESTYVKSSPDEKSANLFMLHSGTRIEVLDGLSGWKKIRIANGNEGWIAADALVVI